MIHARTLLMAALLLALGPGAARADEQKPPVQAGAAVAGVPPGVVDGPTARKLVESGVKVVDVRTPREFEEGHVPGAINIPHDEMARRAREIGPPSTPVLLYCKSGRRSDIAANTLKAKGYKVIYDMQAYDRWVASEPKR